MAVATATALAIGGIAVSAAGTGMSFAQANKQKKLQKQAQADAQKAMEEARKKLEVNYYDQLAVQKEPYELEREALLSSGAQAIQAGVESERGAAATAGRVQMAMNEAQAGIRTAQGKEMADLAKLSAAEESRLRDVGVQLDMEEAAGAQMAARDAQEARAAYMTQGFEGLTSTIQQGIAAAPLYSQNLGAQKSALANTQLTPEQFQQIGNVPQIGGIGAPGTNGFTNLDLQKVSQMSNADYRRFMNQLTPQQRQVLFTDPSYIQNYNPFQPY
jgi:hypothetical protein